MIEVTTHKGRRVAYPLAPDGDSRYKVEVDGVHVGWFRKSGTLYYPDGVIFNGAVVHSQYRGEDSAEMAALQVATDYVGREEGWLR